MMHSTRGFAANIATLLCSSFALLILFVSSSPAAASNPADTAKCVLYTFAHQDDEILIAARIQSDLKAGRVVQVVWSTRGEKGGDPILREKESRASMALLGVPEANLHFLGFNDSESHTTLKAVYDKTLEVAEAVKPDVIFSNAYEGGNIDHDVINYVAEMISRELPNHPPHYEFPLYNAYQNTYQVGKFIPREGVETLYTPMDDAMVKTKLKMLTLYPTQRGTTEVMRRLANPNQMKKKGEVYRLCPHYDYTQPPTEGELSYEMKQNKHPHYFVEFKTVVEGFSRKK